MTPALTSVYCRYTAFVRKISKPYLNCTFKAGGGRKNR
jgi:hypothetical protein